MTDDLQKTGPESTQESQNTGNIACSHLADLLFESKLDRMLAQTGLVKRKIRSESEFLEFVKTAPPVIVILDLRSKRIDSPSLVRTLRGPEYHYRGPILCFGSHVYEEALAAAREAGADKVVTNSAMSSRGERIIAELVQRESD